MKPTRHSTPCRDLVVPEGGVFKDGGDRRILKEETPNLTGPGKVVGKMVAMKCRREGKLLTKAQQKSDHRCPKY